MGDNLHDKAALAAINTIFICLQFWFVDVIIDVESSFGFKPDLIPKDLSI